MVKRILIDGAHPEEPRVVVADDGRLEEFDFESAAKKQLKGNIYLAKITRVEPSLQAAFVEYGGNKQGFLPFSEIHFDYFQIPVADKEKLREIEKQAENEADSDDDSDAPAGDNNPDFPNSVVMENAGIPDAETLELVEEIKTSPESQLEQEVAIENALASSTTLEDESAQSPQDEGAQAGQATASEPNQQDEIEEMGEEADRPVIKRFNHHRKYKIQEVIKRNQIVLIQVVKEERGNKGASLTTYISIAGRYCVLMPNTPRQGGLSRRISSGEDRRRLRDVMDNLDMPDGSSIIIRTAGVDRSKIDIKRDFEYLLKLWYSIRDLALSSEAPALVYEEGNLIKRFIRDMYYSAIEEIMVEGEEAYGIARETMRMFLPSHAGKVKQYAEKMPIFRKYQIEDELVKLYDNRAYLKSGGYIVINPTEALVSIDVNSGRATKERNVEETAAKTNLEAAYEIARQLRLRDLAGLVVIDFIDMMEGRNRRAVERALKDALASDRARIQVGRISPFGLMEMSRQRLRSSFLESNTVTCPHCNGTGMMRSYDSVAVDIIRTIESEAAKGKFEEINIAASPDVVLFVLNRKRAEISAIEANYDVTIVLRSDPAMIAHNFMLDKGRSIIARKPRRERGSDEAGATGTPKDNGASDRRRPIQLDSVLPEESTLSEEEIAAEEEAFLAARRAERAERGEGERRDRGDRGDRGERGERGGRGRRRRGRDRDRNRGGERREGGGRPQQQGAEGNVEAVNELTPDGTGNQRPDHSSDDGGKRVRFRRGREEGANDSRPPREPRPQREPQMAEAQASASGPSHAEQTPSFAMAKPPQPQHTEENQSILRGLWRKMTD